MGQVLSNLLTFVRDKLVVYTTKPIHDDELDELIIIPVELKQQSHSIDIPPDDSSSKSLSITSPQGLSIYPDVPRSLVEDEKEIVLKKNVVKRIGRYTSMQKILLVGEGDFSFSASLAVALGSGSNIFATSFNSQGFLIENYGNFSSNEKEIVSRGGIVMHNVDARAMIKDGRLATLKFDRIVFNFPHAGAFAKTDSDLRKNKELVRGFLRNAKKMINEDGEIHITHKSTGFFLKWDIPKIGSDQGLTLTQEVKFKRGTYPGYHTKYGFGGDKDFDSTPAKTFIFCLLPN